MVERELSELLKAVDTSRTYSVKEVMKALKDSGFTVKKYGRRHLLTISKDGKTGEIPLVGNPKEGLRFHGIRLIQALEYFKESLEED